MRSYKHLSLIILFFFLVAICSPQLHLAQEVHPKKEIFKSLSGWPVTAPGEVRLKNFAPFRAVYERTYRQASGPEAGATRNDRVIVSAEKIGWDGVPGIAITLIDSGIEDKSDTNARVLSMFVGLEKLDVHFEMGPIPGKAKDYYVARLEKNKGYLSQVMTKSQKLMPNQMDLKGPGFGPTTWIMASMPLKPGLKIRLAPSYSPPGNPLTSARYAHVVRKSTFEDSSGRKYSSWIVETSRNFSTPRVSHIHLTDRPPYYLGTETVDLETKERRRFVWLRSTTEFDR